MEQARELVSASNGIQRTLELAQSFASEAKGLAGMLPGSEAREALIGLADKAVERMQ